ncbi:DUF1441 family protein [Ochrobactrum sp. WV_118_8]
MSTWKEQRQRDLAELAGDVLPEKRGRGRPRKGEVVEPKRPPVKKRPAEPEEEFSTSSRDIYKIVNGVSVQWLAKAFGYTRHHVEKRIRGCRIVGSGDYGNPLYDLRDAAAYLVEPKIDLEEYFSKIKPEKLPERLRESFWNAKLKEQRWKRAAGDLWETEKVMTVFAEVLSNIRDKLQLIPDTVERLGGLDVKQWQMVRNLVDQAQEEIFAEMTRFAAGDTTLNQLGQEEHEEEEDLA